MRLSLLLVPAVMASVALSGASALTPTLKGAPSLLRVTSLIGSQSRTNRSTALHYRSYQDVYYKRDHDSLDVDGDRTSLRTLLDPPAPPIERIQTKEQIISRAVANKSARSRSSSRAAQRPSSITQLHSIQDYNEHVINEPSRLCVIRFSAPWCKVCKTTNVAWERMASKLGKSRDSNNNAEVGTSINPIASQQIKFFTVSIDGKNDSTTALKDMLQVKKVPQGIIHHPTQGIFTQVIDLNRGSLSTLKKRLEAYVLNGHEAYDGDEDGKMISSGMLLLEGLKSTATTSPLSVVVDGTEEE